MILYAVRFKSNYAAMLMYPIWLPEKKIANGHYKETKLMYLNNNLMIENITSQL